MRAIRAQVIPVLALGPSSGLHAVADDGSEGVNREVLTRIENEHRRAVGAVADDGEGDNRHRVQATQRSRLTVGGGRLHTAVGLGPCPLTATSGAVGRHSWQQYSAVVMVEDSAFASAYTIEVDPEFPGNGEWGCPVVGFDRSGAVMPDFDSRWGTPFIVRIQPDGGQEWVAMLAAGGLGHLRDAFVTPEPHLLAVVADGLAYLLDARSREIPAQIVHDQVHQVVPSSDPPLLLFVRFIDIVAVGPSGIAWRTPRLCVDDLEVREVGPDGIVCSCDNLGGTATITLDPATGDQVEGARLDSFWPPDAPA